MRNLLAAIQCNAIDVDGMALPFRKTSIGIVFGGIVINVVNGWDEVRVDIDINMVIGLESVAMRLSNIHIYHRPKGESSWKNMKLSIVKVAKRKQNTILECV